MFTINFTAKCGHESVWPATHDCYEECAMCFSKRLDAHDENKRAMEIQPLKDSKIATQCVVNIDPTNGCF